MYVEPPPGGSPSVVPRGDGLVPRGGLAALPPVRLPDDPEIFGVAMMESLPALGGAASLPCWAPIFFCLLSTNS